MSKMVATCGHELPEDDMGISVCIKQYNGVSHQTLCSDCLMFHLKHDLILASYEEQINYLDELGIDIDYM